MRHEQKLAYGFVSANAQFCLAGVQASGTIAAKFAYVANRGSNDVSAYSIGSNGALTPVPGSPFATGVGPFSVALNP